MTERAPLHGTLSPGPTSARWALLCGSEAADGNAFASPHVQIIHNWTNEPWADPLPHQHSGSDEIHVVLDGAMRLDVAGARLDIRAGEFLCIPAGVDHQLLGVECPHRSLVIRGPSLRDKIEGASADGGGRP